jgi:hypothetical protein
MHVHQCGSSCSQGCGLSRRRFLATGAASVASALLLGSCTSQGERGTAPVAGDAALRQIRQMGPASKCVPTVKVCFVRRKAEYGMLWPGAVYDGEAALKKYTEGIAATAKGLNMKLDLRPVPIYTPAEADAWVAEAVQTRPDGLLVVLLDRQHHAWPTAAKAIDTQIPTVIFSPLGTSFTTSTAAPSAKPGCFIASTDDFRQVQYGMKMLHAGARLKATRCLVIKGTETTDSELPHLGIALHTIPAGTFLDMYQKTPDTPEILAMADDLRRRATGMYRATHADIINGIKSYVVARTLVEREQADAITMDCLGALGHTKVSLPCIAWSKMNDDGIPAACEADLGAVATHCLVQYLFDRPGFQQDPVADTAMDAIIGAHCSCPTRLNGFGQPPEPYDIVHHHGERDATARTRWREGQRVTLADVVPGSKTKPTQIIIAAGAVVDNVSVPPAGGCVVSVRVKFDGATNVLQFPGFHQLFFYGDFKKELVEFCHLFKLEPVLA